MHWALTGGWGGISQAEKGGDIVSGIGDALVLGVAKIDNSGGRDCKSSGEAEREADQKKQCFRMHCLMNDFTDIIPYVSCELKAGV